MFTAESAHVAAARPSLVAFAAGKGGCGRSLIAANVAVYLAQIGHRVALLDLDLGNANLHTFLGLGSPQHTLDDFVHRRGERIDGLLVPTRVEGLRLLAAAHDPLSASSLKHGSRTRLISHLAQIDADFLVADTTVGTGLMTLDLFNLADAAVVVTTPEPTSVERYWRFLCAAFVRRTMRAAPPPAVRSVLEAAFDRPGRPAPTPGALCRAVLDVDPEQAAMLLEQKNAFRSGLVVAMTRTPEDRELGSAIGLVARHHLDVAVDVLGSVSFEDAARFSVSRMRPVLLEYPKAEVSRDLEQVVHHLLACLGGSSAKPETRRKPDSGSEEARR